MDGSSINLLPQDTLQLIFSALPLLDIIKCRSVCRSFNQILTSSSFIDLISTKPPLHLIALRPPHHNHHYRHQITSQPSIHVFDTYDNKWLRFSLDFLPFGSPHSVASAGGLIYLWGNSMTSTTESIKSLVVCNPLTRQYRVLPQLGSAWSRHGSVLVDSEKGVMVLTELAALYYCGSDKWLKFSSNLPSKPRSPVLISNSVYALCDIGCPWRSRWRVYTCTLGRRVDNHHNWVCLERAEWGDIFDIIKRPRLVCGSGKKKILMIGGLKSTFSLNPACSTMLILRLDLETLEWEEAGRMPVDMYSCFQESTKFKVFGGGDKVCFSAKRVAKFALWDATKGWRWIHDVPGNGDGIARGFIYQAQLTAFP